MSTTIINRGRGPEIAGTRITVYDIVYETSYGHAPQEIADAFELTVAEVQTALEYIEAHKDEVMRDYQAIQARHARGNPPELQAKLDATHAKYAPLWEELRRRARANREAADAGNSGGLGINAIRGVGRLYVP